MIQNEETIGKEEQQGRSAVPAEIRENAAETIMTERRLAHWLDEAYSETCKNGGFDDLPGKGKSIHVQGGDALHSIMKNANVLPPWLELQHVIRDQIAEVLERMKSDEGYAPGADLEQINKSISSYSKMVPSHLLQKPKLTPENAAAQIYKWL